MANEDPAELLVRWRAGDQQAAAELFRRYADRLIALARGRLSARLAQRVDPEDVVQSVYHSFFADSRQGRYELQRGGDLWHLLVALTLHKLQSLVQHHAAQKRAAGREQNFGSEDSLVRIQGSTLAGAPSPLEAIALTDELEQVLRRLEPRHRPILVLRLNGKNLDEIAVELNCSERTVRRVLDRVKQELAPGLGLSSESSEAALP